MANCNDCKKLKAVKEEDNGVIYINHKCSTHKATVRYTEKRFRGFIWPCDLCNGVDFKQK